MAVVATDNLPVQFPLFKWCKGCEQFLPFTYFYLHAKSRDGLRSRCRGCIDVQNRQWRAANPERIAEYEARYSKEYETRPDRRTKHAERSRRRYEEFPEQRRAVSTVNHAIRAGGLVRLPCYKCSSSKSEAHHEDYSRPLDVIWVCKPHHIELDKARRARLCQ